MSERELDLIKKSSAYGVLTFCDGMLAIALVIFSFAYYNIHVIANGHKEDAIIVFGLISIVGAAIMIKGTVDFARFIKAEKELKKLRGEE